METGLHRLLIYNDATIFGGQEKATLMAVDQLLQHTRLEIFFMFYEGNARLHQQLMQFQQKSNQIHLIQTKHKTRAGQGIITLLSPLEVNLIKIIMKEIQPDLVVISQGGIEVSSLGLMAAHRGGFSIASFIPIAHRLRDLGYRLGVIRDFVNIYYYRLPNGFITVTDNLKNMLNARGARGNVFTVGNGVDFNHLKQLERKLWRDLYGISEQDYAIALIGRIYFRQKGHDLLINALADNKLRLENMKLLIVGDGPDEDALKLMISSKGLENFVKFISWSNNPSSIYSAADMVVIPSRFEGLPLVMLEAMYFGLPVTASNIDGMADLLPKEWLFQNSSPNSIIETLLRVKEYPKPDVLLKNKQMVATEFNMKIFGERFFTAIKAIAKAKP